MPWIKEEDCVACGLCVDECPVDAITLSQATAVINDAVCIRCGKCHDICPQEAVRHDSERIPLEVEANVLWARELLTNFDSADAKRGLVDRMKRYFNKERKVAEQSIEKMDDLMQEF